MYGFESQCLLFFFKIFIAIFGLVFQNQLKLSFSADFFPSKKLQENNVLQCSMLFVRINVFLISFRVFWKIALCFPKISHFVPKRNTSALFRFFKNCSEKLLIMSVYFLYEHFFFVQNFLSIRSLLFLEQKTLKNWLQKKYFPGICHFLSRTNRKAKKYLVFIILDGQSHFLPICCLQALNFKKLNLNKFIQHQQFRFGSKILYGEKAKNCPFYVRSRCSYWHSPKRTG